MLLFFNRFGFLVTVTLTWWWTISIVFLLPVLPSPLPLLGTSIKMEDFSSLSRYKFEKRSIVHVSIIGAIANSMSQMNRFSCDERKKKKINFADAVYCKMKSLQTSRTHYYRFV